GGGGYAAAHRPDGKGSGRGDDERPLRERSGPPAHDRGGGGSGEVGRVPEELFRTERIPADDDAALSRRPRDTPTAGGRGAGGTAGAGGVGVRDGPAGERGGAPFGRIRRGGGAGAGIRAGDAGGGARHGGVVDAGVAALPRSAAAGAQSGSA